MKHLILLALGLSLLASCESGSDSGTKSDTVGWNDSLATIYMERGKMIAQSTFQTLSSTLTTTMQAEGPSGAVSYCQLEAYPLTDSLSDAYEASIRRTSHKVRNPSNAASDSEQGIIDKYLAAMEAGNKPTPVVKPHGQDYVRFYAPIILQQQCVVCHGVPGESLTTSLHKEILKKYPNDQAVGFQVGDLRGIWSITMKQSM